MEKYRQWPLPRARYTRRDNGEILYRGFMRRTIRNGYEIDFDMQIYGRSTTNKDNTNLNKIWETFTFVEVLPLPPKASARILITDEPPAETNEQEFEIEGHRGRGRDPDRRGYGTELSRTHCNRGDSG